MSKITVRRDGTRIVDRNWVHPGFEMPAKTPQQLEDEVQAEADLILQGRECDRALARATVDLAIGVRDGDLNGMSRSEVRQVFRDRIVHHLREKRGLS